MPLLKVKRGYARNFLIPKKKAGKYLILFFCCLTLSSYLVYLSPVNKLKYASIIKVEHEIGAQPDVVRGQPTIEPESHVVV